MAKIALLAGSMYGFLGVLLGAFAAHALKSKVSEKLLASFQVGTKYQLIHAVVLLALGLLCQNKSSTLLNSSILLCVVGILLFSGSIYGLVLLRWKVLGPITPLGGLCLIASWLCLFLHVAYHVSK